MRRRRARHSDGPLGCLYAVVGFAACVGVVVGAWHIATDPASVEPSSAIVEPARVEPTMRATPRATPRRTARPTVRPSAHTRATAEPAGALVQCLVDQGIDPDTLDIDTIDPAEYDC